MFIRLIDKVKENNMNDKTQKKDKAICAVLTIGWIILSFFMIDIREFSFVSPMSYFNYVSCKALVIIFFAIVFWNIITIFRNHGFKSEVKMALMLTAPVLLIVSSVSSYLLKDDPGRYILMTGDTGLIFDCAKRLECYYDFHFLTSWFYIIALMICPNPIFVIVFKEIVWTSLAFFIFYSTQLMFSNSKIKISTRFFLYLIIYYLFTFLPILLLMPNCHRIYCYTPFLAFVYFWLYIIYTKKKRLSFPHLICISLAVACVSQWRPEGIVVSLATFLILFKTFSKYKVKYKLTILASLILANILVFIPQNLETFSSRLNYSDVRLHPLYSYRLTTMLYENRIDENKYKKELAEINKVISIDAIKKLNNDFGKQTYEDGYIRWYEGYIGVTHSYSMDNYRKYVRGELNSNENIGFGSKEYENYANSCKKIFKTEAVGFIKSCINTFLYVECYGNSVGNSNGYIPMPIIRIYYSLIFAAVINIFILISAIIKKNWFCIFYSICMYLQAGIVLVMAPAGYYKYYLPSCFCVYMGLMILYIDCARNRKIVINERT